MKISQEQKILKKKKKMYTPADSSFTIIKVEYKEVYTYLRNKESQQTIWVIVSRFLM